MAKKKYTLTDLKINSKAYSNNFDNMVKYAGTKRQAPYIKKEKELNAKDIAIRVNLGIMSQDPCRLTKTSTCCLSCTGWYKKLNRGVNPITREVKPNTPGAILCTVKENYE